MSWWTNLTTTVVKDEQWLVKEIAQGWAAIQAEAHKIEVDVLGIFDWVQKHQVAIETVFKNVLGDLSIVGALLPQTAPVVATATAAIDAATAAIDVLSKGIQAGTTPLSTITNAYHAVKDAQSAVNAVLKSGTAKPTAPST